MCFQQCYCYYKFDEKGSVLDCSNLGITNLTHLLVPNETTWLIAEDNSINHLKWSQNLYQIEHFNLQNSSLYSISVDFLSKLKNTGKANYLNLAGNKLKNFNQALVEIILPEIYLGGNPIDCNCDMFWFVEWLNTTYFPSGPRIVKDYRDIKCDGGDWNGAEVYKLSKEQMGCLPTVLEL